LTPVSNKCRYLRTARTDQGTIEVVQILVKSFQKDTLHIGIQSFNCVVDKICVKLAELCEIGGVWVGRVAVECAIVGAWGNGVLREDKIDTVSDVVEGNRFVRPEEPIWEAAVLEESPCNVHVELPARIAPVYEEHKGEDGLGVCGEVPGRDEAELRVGGNGILDSLEPEFCSHRKVIETGTELITEGGELEGKIVERINSKFLCLG
jgi:hypothetical protein